ncbi:CesD/SycD/LcrH family type III secretion system chaperone SscA [Salmonella enterica subsp. salamae]|nr:CesD/SycD/LcrH family type III secretion system chaperone SscA [Salmonella enterica subsp. salamae]ECJ2280084.1 CesD/SycD/LcrH family type III secretion system chaperone SscA [Salmonella enterica subsp. salamae]HCC0886909.1 CesD/SycD/LcrH family type III secretion system chaperone SscA [Salmonella enterica]
MKKGPNQQQIQDAMRFFRQGGSLRMLLDDDVTQPLDTLYRYAMQLVDIKEYAGAARLFQLLTIYDAWSFDYWFRLGECCQAQQVWGDAIYAYGRAARIRLDAPQAPWGAAECYLACDNYDYAKKALKAVVRICGEASEHQSLRGRAEKMLQQLADRS